MRLYLTIFLLLLLFTPAKSQNGFLQSYDYEGGGLGFYNMLLTDDTLIVYGSAKHPDLSQWGLYFAKLDTMGNILGEVVHYDSLGRSYAFEQGYKMIKVADGGYVITGLIFQQIIPSLFKLDLNGELEFVQEYPDTTVSTSRHWNIIETANGYITTGVKQQMDDGLWDTFIMGTDKAGEKLWETSYGEYEVWDRLRGIQKINENEFLITGSTFISSSQVEDKADMWAIPKAVKIDTLGQITWEWEGGINYTGGSYPGLGQLFPTSDGNWVNEGSVGTLFEDNILTYQGEIVKRDTNFNVIWNTVFGEPTSNTNNFVNIAPSPDGGWAAVGQYLNKTEDDPLGGFRSAMIAKVSADGDSLWSRLDTLFDHTIIASKPYLSGVVVLPSGSIIACGHVDKTWPNPGKSYGWLIKVDKDGCMEPGCNPIIDGTNLTPLLENFEVYPNPVSDKFTINGEGFFDVRIMDINGGLMRQKTNIFNQTNLEITNYPAGSYFVQIRKGNTWLMKKILKM